MAMQRSGVESSHGTDRVCREPVEAIRRARSNHRLERIAPRGVEFRGIRAILPKSRVDAVSQSIAWAKRYSPPWLAFHPEQAERVQTTRGKMSCFGFAMRSDPLADFGSSAGMAGEETLGRSQVGEEVLDSGM